MSETRGVEVRGVLDRLAMIANDAHRGLCRNAVVAGQALIKAKEIVGHGGWRQWIAEHCEFSERTAQVYMQLARNPQTAAHSIQEALRSRGWHRFLDCTGDEEWYTPPAIIEAARTVLGGIDLDPASCEQANAVVRATRFFTRTDDGLAQPWRARGLWLNPPYSADKIAKFSEKLVHHYQIGDVLAAIVLVHSLTEARWFATLVDAASALCFHTSRVKFVKPGIKTANPTTGTTIFYFGPETENFRRVFSTFGSTFTIAEAVAFAHSTRLDDDEEMAS